MDYPVADSRYPPGLMADAVPRCGQRFEDQLYGARMINKFGYMRVLYAARHIQADGSSADSDPIDLTRSQQRSSAP
jgi:hypothetical protein